MKVKEFGCVENVRSGREREIQFERKDRSGREKEVGAWGWEIKWSQKW